MTTLKVSKTSAGSSFKPQVGLGSTSRLTAKRQYPSWRRWMTGVLTGASVLAVIAVAFLTTIA